MKRLRASLSSALDGWPYLSIFVLSILLTLILEILGRQSVAEVIGLLRSRPLVFLSNMALIFGTLALVLPFRRRVFIASLISVIWLGFGITNACTLLYRGTPFSARDFALVVSFIQVADVYFKAWQLILIAVVLVGLVVAFVYIFRKAPRAGFASPVRVLVGMASAVVFVLSACFYMGSRYDLNADFTSINDAYENCGFPYCFMSSIFQNGIGRPDDYSEERVDNIIESIDPDPEGKLPNVIFVQLESFIDPSQILGVEFEHDPIPNFTALKESYPSGYLTVPTIGGATVNTEFEVLTGMNLDYFGVGEYPYESVLQDTPCESLASIFSQAGLTPQAIHNHSGSFYDRNIVYSNLGFKTYTSLEYMTGVTYNPSGWANDAVLTDCIANCLADSEGRDFIFAVSVQAHGRYPDDPDADDPNIRFDDEHAEAYEGIEYYVNQLTGSDTFIGQLVDYLKIYPEPVVVVFYGDHLPSMRLTDDKLASGSIHKTEYVIWSNIGLRGRDMDLDAFRLSSRLFQLIGFDGGILPEYHRAYYGSESYEEGLELLQYDMLYGDRLAYEGREPEATELRMGLLDIRISSVTQSGSGRILVSGDDFTPYSIVFVNGHRRATNYLDSKRLAADASLSHGDVVTVVQLASDRVVLSETEPFVY